MSTIGVDTAPSFAELFKKYRLRSEFETLGEFSDELLGRGLHYEESIFSHWQKGTRTPRDRKLIIILISIFVERRGLTTIQEANELLESIGQGYLTTTEINRLPSQIIPQAPFQAPREISNFSGRSQYLKEIACKLSNHESVLIAGGAGIGKTSCAIQIAHMLQNSFPDGVLWYRLDTSNPESILNSICHTYGEDISQIQNTFHKAAFVRSLLSNKHVLIIYDNLERDYPLDFLLPTSPLNTVLITSQYKDLADKFDFSLVNLDVFTKKETEELLIRILGKDYFLSNKSKLTDISTRLGNLPLAINIIGKKLTQPYIYPKSILEKLTSNTFQLEDLSYENKNVVAALNIAYESFSSCAKNLLASLSIFSSSDFSFDAVAAINMTDKNQLLPYLNELIAASFCDRSTEDRFKIHPLIKLFAYKKLKIHYTTKLAANYYEKLLKVNKNKVNYLKLLDNEIENLVEIYKKSCEFNYVDVVKRIWPELFCLLWDLGEWTLVKELTKLTYSLALRNKDIDQIIMCDLEGFSWIEYWTGNTNSAEWYTKEALKLSKLRKNEYLISYSNLRLGRILQGRRKFSKSLKLLIKALDYFSKTPDYLKASCCCRHLAETYSFMNKHTVAEKYIKKSLYYLNKTDNFTFAGMYRNLLFAHLGALYLIRNKINKARYYFEKGVKIDIKCGSITTALLWNHMGLGLVGKRAKNSKEAERHFAKAINIVNRLQLGDHLKNRHVFYAMLFKEISSTPVYSVIH